jgi:hypothetical protein
VTGPDFVARRNWDWRTGIRFVVSIEDTVYFHWQLPIFLESLVAQLPSGSGIDVVVCNDYATLSDDLVAVFATYGDAVRCLLGTNFGGRRIEVHSEEAYDDFTVEALGSHAFLDVHERPTPRGYVPLNRVEALNVVGDTLAADMIVLMDPDIFLYGKLNPACLPDRNSLQDNKIIRRTPFFSLGQKKGVLLPELLRALQCETQYLPGGVTVFLDGQTVANKKFITDCFRFGQLMYLAGRIVGVPKVWLAEMPCFSLALTFNNIPYQVIDGPEFSTEIRKESLPDGTFYHYYGDYSDGHGFGAFPGSRWCKQLHRHENFLLTADLDALRQESVTDHERFFFDLAKSAKTRLGW